MDFFVDDNHHLNLLTGSEIFTYSMDGRYITKKGLPVFATHAIYFSDSLIAFKKSWSNYIEGATSIFETKIVISDINFKEFDYSLRFDLRNYDAGPVDFPIVFSKSNESIYFFELFNDTIYKVSDNKMNPYCYFNFGSVRVPQEYYSLKRTELMARLQEKQKRASSPHDYFDTGKYIFLIYFYDGNIIYVVQNTETGELNQAKAIINDLDNLPYNSPLSIHKGQLVYCLSALDVLAYQKQHKVSTSTLLLNLTENNNPLVVMVKLKN